MLTACCSCSSFRWLLPCLRLLRCRLLLLLWGLLLPLLLLLADALDCRIQQRLLRTGSVLRQALYELHEVPGLYAEQGLQLAAAVQKRHCCIRCCFVQLAQQLALLLLPCLELRRSSRLVQVA